MQLCRTIIDAACEAGADAVKFQSWTRSSLICEAEFERNSSYSDTKRHFGSLREMVERYEFTPQQHTEISDYCQKIGIDFMSSVFSRGEVDLVLQVGAPALKIASMDVTHLPLLEYVGSKGAPIILSTGMATLGEVEDALAAIRRGGNADVVLLHCVAVYPTPPELLNLKNITTLATTFGVPVGFSDHSLGSAAAVGAVALGACIIEKHFTINKELDGWDHHMSADPAEMRRLVQEGRFVHSALGSPMRIVSQAEMEKRLKFRRRAVAARALPVGTVLKAADLEFKRPGNGIGPNELGYIVGRVLQRPLKLDEEIIWSDIGPVGAR
ncbi:MAG: N-acetylneuraminate synthase family protein [Deltaproteobacteria bacterium]|nr:N-acetylneuraminate synthase family protein [Deltaproteobacteria bacterium]